MDENMNLNNVESEAEKEPAPVEKMWTEPVAEPAEESAVEAPAEVEQPVAPATVVATNAVAAQPTVAPVYVNQLPLEKNTADHGMALASMILGIAGLVACCCYGILGIVLGAVGLILGIIARKHGNNEGISLAGIILSAISLGFGLLFFGIVLLGVIGMLSDPEFMESFYEDYYSQNDTYGDYIKMFFRF